jgi:hypothetical protein
MIRAGHPNRQPGRPFSPVEEICTEDLQSLGLMALLGIYGQRG